MKTTLILACAGKGERANFVKNKLLVKFGGKTVLERTLSVFYKSGLIDEYIISSALSDIKEIKSLVPKEVTVVVGGETRTQSVKNALSVASGDIVLIHDGARPNLTEKIIADCIDSASKYGSAVTIFPSRNTVCSVIGGVIENYLGKDGLFSVQTPQAFKTDEIKKAYALSGEEVFNDDGEVYAKYIGRVHTVTGCAENVKLTFGEDFKLYETESNNCRFGTGFDCHKLVENRKLILGGIEIPHDKGLLGHSDADVLTHAIMDAILSACAMRDIGYYFPDNDDAYKGADSIKLLQQVLDMIGENGYKLKSVSAVIMADKPKLLKYIPDITNRLSDATGIPQTNIGIGATTLEGLGFVGREEGICVHTTAVVYSVHK